VRRGVQKNCGELGPIGVRRLLAVRWPALTGMRCQRRQIIFTLLPLSPKGNAWNSRLRSAMGGATVWTSTKEAPDGRHATPLPVRSTLTAGPCSSSLHPTVGRSFSRA
jgi:hypothetical protein